MALKLDTKAKDRTLADFPIGSKAQFRGGTYTVEAHPEPGEFAGLPYVYLVDGEWKGWRDVSDAVWPVVPVK